MVHGVAIQIFSIFFLGGLQIPTESSDLIASQGQPRQVSTTTIPGHSLPMFRGWMQPTIPVEMADVVRVLHRPGDLIWLGLERKSGKWGKVSPKFSGLGPIIHSHWFWWHFWGSTAIFGIWLIHICNIFSKFLGMNESFRGIHGPMVCPIPTDNHPPSFPVVDQGLINPHKQ